MESHKRHVPNHQPDIDIYIYYITILFNHIPIVVGSKTPMKTNFFHHHIIFTRYENHKACDDLGSKTWNCPALSVFENREVNAIPSGNLLHSY